MSSALTSTNIMQPDEAMTQGEAKAPLWLGTGMHYALEDFHGYNRYQHTWNAFMAYSEASRTAGDMRPDDHLELTELMVGMLDYYENHWLPAYPSERQFETLWVDGVPQVEVEFEILLPIDPRIWYPDCKYHEVYYQGKIDRVAIDEFGRLWLIDYKSAKQFETVHLDIDPQISAYCWAAEIYYQQEVAGMIYQQHRKTVPQLPRILANGSVSTSSQQLTTHLLYRKTLVDLYGKDTSRWPANNMLYLNALAENMNPDGDAYVRYDRAERNQAQKENEYQKIMRETADMLNPGLLIYPNPTRECARWCPVRTACVLIDSDGDWQSELEEVLKPRKEAEQWQKHLPDPDQFNRQNLQSQ
jgi:hypothetical protein